MAKPVEHGITQKPAQFLVTLEDLTSLRGSELYQGVYLVVFGFNLEMHSAKVDSWGPKREFFNDFNKSKKLHNPNPMTLGQEYFTKVGLGSIEGEFEKQYIQGDFVKYKNTVEDFFFCLRTSVIPVQRGRAHQFLNGIPLFYGRPLREASIYVAVVEIPHPDPEALKLDFWNELEKRFESKLSCQVKESIEALQEIDYEIDWIREPGNDYIVDIAYRESLIDDRFSINKKNFSIMIKEIEKLVLENKQNIRYTNVFTIKADDDLEGGHKDWGDHRMGLTVNVEMAP
jgi:hypothetical protein